MDISPDMAPAGAKSAHKQKTRFTIRELVNEFGVTARALRFYEDKGLLHPGREGRTRIYKRRDRARLKLILQGKRVGFSLAEIREMMDLYDLRDGQCTQLQVSLGRFGERIRALEKQKLDIEQAIADLKRTCAIVRGMLAEKRDSRNNLASKPASNQNEFNKEA